jgi:serine/threonine-protein kinase
VDTLGSGGMGTVYLAESVSLGTFWAVKAIPRRQGANFDLLAEPNILKKLSHPALPRIVDIEQDEEYLYIIEDYIEGVPLDKQLHTRKSFDEATVIEWAKQLCRVLMYLHSQPHPIIYRDMKPSNIIVSADNTVKVVDFGIAREYKTDSGSDTSYMGTRGYAAPEQYGTSQTDARTDIYALGVTLYHLLTGKSPNEPPYQFQPLRQLERGFSEGIEFIVNKCVQNDPRDRYQSVAELLHDLDNIHIFNSYYRRQIILGRCAFALKLVLLAGFSYLMFFSVNLLASESEERYYALVDSGYEALTAYDYAGAETDFQAAIAENNEKHNAYLGVAQIDWQRGAFAEGAAYLEMLAESLPEITEDAAYNYLVGLIRYDDSRYEQALPYLQKAASLTDDITYQRDLGVCYAKLGQLEEALQVLAGLESAGGYDDAAAYVRGEIELARGETDAAVADFSLIKVSTDEFLKKKAYLALAAIYKDTRGTDPQALSAQIAILEEAERELRAVGDVVLTEAMAEAYYAAANYELSREKFQQLLTVGYERPYIYRNLAIIAQQTGNFSEAEDRLLEMIGKYPDNYQGYLQLAFLYIEEEGRQEQGTRDYTEAVRYYELACQYAPEGETTADILPLGSLIAELREKGWL